MWFGIMLTTMLLFAGFAVDLGIWFLNARETQKAADAAATAAVVPRASGVNDARALAESVALETAERNGFVDGEDGVTVEVDLDGVDANQARVNVEREVKPYFLSAIGFDAVTVRRDATAEYNAPTLLGSPEPVLGNEPVRASDDWPQLTSSSLGQTFWLDVHGPRTSVGHGDLYQSNDCGTAYGWPFEACTETPPTTGNRFHDEPSDAGPAGQEGYYLTIDVEEANGELLEVQIFDPTFAIQDSDCRARFLTEPATTQAQLFATHSQLRASPFNYWYGGLESMVEVALDSYLSGSTFNIGRLQGAGISEALLQEIVDEGRYTGGPGDMCSGDDHLGSNVCALDPVVCLLLGLLTGGGGWWGGSDDGSTDVGPIPRAPSSSETPTVSPLFPYRGPRPDGQPSRVPTRPVDVYNPTEFDGTVETQFTLLEGVNPNDPNDPANPIAANVAADSQGSTEPGECRDTYGVHPATMNLLQKGDDPSGYWNAFFLNSSDRSAEYGFGSEGTEYGHGFREHFRRWATHCTIQLPNTGEEARYYLRINTNTRDPLLGAGANRFSVRAAKLPGPDGTGVEVHADKRMAVMGNFTGSGGGTGEFYLTELLPSAVDRRLVASFYDVGDIAGCPTEDRYDPDDPCVRAGEGVLSGLSGSLSLLDPATGGPFATCELYLDSEYPEDAPDQTLSPCTMSDIDFSKNGRLIELVVPIGSSSYACAAAGPDACWIRARFDWDVSGLPTDWVLRPEDVSTWSVRLEGDPVRLVE